MKGKIVFTIALLLFTVSVTGLGNSEKAAAIGNPVFEQNDLDGEMPDTEMNSAAVIGFGSFSISKRSARTGRNPQTGKDIQSSGDESDQALANRMLESIKASNCPEDGRERCIAESVKNTEVYSDLSSRAEIEILMTLTADPLVVPRSESSGDCNDTDTDLRPGELSEKICHFIDPDSDGDGLDDLTMEQIENRYDWKINGEKVANATVYSARAAETQLFFLQVESSKAEVASRPELVEAIAEHSGLSKADSKKALDSFLDATLAVELDKSSPYIYQGRSDVDNGMNANSSGVQWPYNLKRQAPTHFILEYGPAPTSRAGWPPLDGSPINASVPPTAKIVSESGDCNDTNEDGRPVLCGQTTHFLSPNFDGDGFEDLLVVETEEGLIWKIDSEVMVTAGISSVVQTSMNEETTGTGSKTVFLNIEEASTRPELVEAIASKSGLSRAESEKALDGFIFISMKVAYDELDKSTPYLARNGDRASPEIQDELMRRDARIAELEERIRELESDGEINSSQKDNGNDVIVRKKPGRNTLDDDSDGDGLSDAVEEDSEEPIRRPGFINRMLSSIIGR